jgi:hypothetical protein
MDVNEYKLICSRPDAFDRGILEATAQELSSSHPPSASRLREALEGAPIPKPELHTGGGDTDYFIVKLDTAEAEQIVEYLLDAEAEAVGWRGETTREASRISGLIASWVRYIDFCDAAAI